MIRPDYREIKRLASPFSLQELYHYGMPERSGRYAWGSGDRPYQRLEGKASRMEKRLKKNFERKDAKTAGLQAQANKNFNKASQQRNSVFQFRRNAAEKSFNKGYNIQEKKQRIEYRMSKQYERYVKKFENLGLVMDKDLQAKGLDYYNRVIANSDSQYRAALHKRVS